MGLCISTLVVDPSVSPSVFTPASCISTLHTAPRVALGILSEWTLFPASAAVFLHRAGEEEGSLHTGKTSPQVPTLGPPAGTALRWGQMLWGLLADSRSDNYPPHLFATGDDWKMGLSGQLPGG